MVLCILTILIWGETFTGFLSVTVEEVGSVVGMDSVTWKQHTYGLDQL